MSSAIPCRLNLQTYLLEFVHGCLCKKGRGWLFFFPSCVRRFMRKQIRFVGARASNLGENTHMTKAHVINSPTWTYFFLYN